MFILSLHYNGSNSFLSVNATKIYQFKANNSEIKDYANIFLLILILFILAIFSISIDI